MKNSSILQTWMKNKNAITNWIYEHEEEMIQLARYIWEHPETAYEEKLSSKCLGEYLEKNPKMIRLCFMNFFILPS